MKRKPFLYVICAIVICAVCATLGIVIWQWNNLQALYLVATLDENEVGEKMESIREEHHQALEEEHQIVIKPPSRQQGDDLLDGKVTPEEVKASLGLVTDSSDDEVGITEPLPNVTESTTQIPITEDFSSIEVPKPPESETVQTEIVTNVPKPPTESTTAVTTAKPEPVAPVTTAPVTTAPVIEKPKPSKTAQQIVNECVAELYACKIDVMASLGDIKKEMLDIWKALSPEERTYDRKMKIGLDGLEKCYDYEVEVDSKVQSILSKYRKELSAIGADTKVLDTLWQYYCEEKAFEKAYYINKYL